MSKSASCATLVGGNVWWRLAFGVVNTRRRRQVMADDGVLYAVDPFPKGRFGFSGKRKSPIERQIVRRTAESAGLSNGDHTPGGDRRSHAGETSTIAVPRD